MNKKLFYTAPTSSVFEVRFEGSILQGSNPPGSPGTRGYSENPLDDLGD